MGQTIPPKYTWGGLYPSTSTYYKDFKKDITVGLPLTGLTSLAELDIKAPEVWMHRGKAEGTQQVIAICKPLGEAKLCHVFGFLASITLWNLFFTSPSLVFFVMRSLADTNSACKKALPYVVFSSLSWVNYEHTSLNMYTPYTLTQCLRVLIAAAATKYHDHKASWRRKGW